MEISETQLRMLKFVLYDGYLKDRKYGDLSWNQRVDKIRIKRLSGDYQQAIIYIIQNILGESIGTIKRSIIISTYLFFDKS